MYWREIAEQKTREAQKLAGKLRTMQNSLFWYGFVAISGWGLAINLMLRGVGAGE